MTTKVSTSETKNQFHFSCSSKSTVAQYAVYCVIYKHEPLQQQTKLFIPVVIVFVFLVQKVISSSSTTCTTECTEIICHIMHPLLHAFTENHISQDKFMVKAYFIVMQLTSYLRGAYKFLVKTYFIVMQLTSYLRGADKFMGNAFFIVMQLTSYLRGTDKFMVKAYFIVMQLTSYLRETVSSNPTTKKLFSS